VPLTRPAAVAGLFYPAERAALERQIGGLLAAVAAPSAPAPKAIIAPHAGYLYAGAVAAGAYARLAPARGRIARVVLLGPSHYVGFRGLAAGSAEAWQTPLGTVPVERRAIERLTGAGFAQILDAAHAREHALEVHVPFLQAVLGEFTLVPIVAGDAAPEAAAGLVESVWGGPETLVVISTDLSHYLDYEACRDTDRRTAAAIEAFEGSAIGPEGACGRVPVAGLLAVAKRRGMTIARLDLRNSGDTAGPRDRVVGYGSWALDEPMPQPAATGGEDRRAALGPALIELACAAIAGGLTGDRPNGVQLPRGLPAALSEPGAAFVTLRRRGELRGCVGSAVARRALAADVVDNAFRAAFEDPRFPPLRLGELEGLELSVAVLTPPEPMRFRDEADLLGQLRPHVDGLIIEDGGRRALFLPAVWDMLPKPRQFLGQLRLKAGMAADHWSAAFRASRFTAEEIAAGGNAPDLLRLVVGLAARHAAADGLVRLRGNPGG
jgi:MEMO1 family protein